MCIFIFPLRSIFSSPFCTWDRLNPPPSSQVTEFPQFSRFPPEIRQQIWSEAVRFPRFVLTTGRGSCSNAIPALLHVSRESRDIALPTYSLLFADIDPPYIELFYEPPNDHMKMPERPPRPKPFYFNYERDTLQYNIWRIAKVAKCWPQDAKNLAKIKRIAVSNNWWQWANPHFRRDLPLFEAAEEVIFVMDDCKGKNIESIRTQPDENVVEWSEDGKLIMLRTGKLVEKFREEVKRAMQVGEANSVWKPSVSIGMYVDTCLVEVMKTGGFEHDHTLLEAMTALELAA